MDIIIIICRAAGVDPKIVVREATDKAAARQIVHKIVLRDALRSPVPIGAKKESLSVHHTLGIQSWNRRIKVRVRRRRPIRKLVLTKSTPNRRESETIFAVRLGVRFEKWHFGSDPELSVSNQRAPNGLGPSAAVRHKPFDVLRICAGTNENAERAYLSASL